MQDYEKEIQKAQAKLVVLRQQLTEDINKRVELLTDILAAFNNVPFEVIAGQNAKDSVVELKTNSLTKLLKEIYDLETYINQIKVERMMKQNEDKG